MNFENWADFNLSYSNMRDRIVGDPGWFKYEHMITPATSAELSFPELFDDKLASFRADKKRNWEELNLVYNPNKDLWNRPTEYSISSKKRTRPSQSSGEEVEWWFPPSPILSRSRSSSLSSPNLSRLSSEERLLDFVRWKTDNPELYKQYPLLKRSRSISPHNPDSGPSLSLEYPRSRSRTPSPSIPRPFGNLSELENIPITITTRNRPVFTSPLSIPSPPIIPAIKTTSFKTPLTINIPLSQSEMRPTMTLKRSRSEFGNKPISKRLSDIPVSSPRPNLIPFEREKSTPKASRVSFGLAPARKGIPSFTLFDSPFTSPLTVLPTSLNPITKAGIVRIEKEMKHSKQRQILAASATPQSIPEFLNINLRQTPPHVAPQFSTAPFLDLVSQVGTRASNIFESEKKKNKK